MQLTLPAGGHQRPGVPLRLSLGVVGIRNTGKDVIGACAGLDVLD